MSEGHAEKNVVLRERALATIESAHEARVVVVTGAAGSGKSTLVRQWAQRLGPGRSVAWLTLDPADNNPSRWWAHLRAELLTAAPGLVWAPGSEADRESIELLLEELVAEHPDLVLVIDDLHFVVDPRVVAALDSLVAGLGPTMRLALVSRTRPTLRLARGVVAGDVVQVRGKDLFFSPEETRDALLARGVRSEDEIAAHVSAIQELTGGWPVAVALTARLPLAAVDLEPPHLGDTGRDLADYLTEEVFLAQPPHVQQFLLDTVVLDTLSVKAANALRGQLDAATHLDYLERNDLFLSPVPQQSPMCWQLHSVIRDHLSERLERDEPSRWAELHRKAAQLFAASDLERAVSHALAAAAYDLALDLIESRLDQTATADYIEGSMLVRWLEAVPDEAIRQRPVLCARAIMSARFSRRDDLYERWSAVRPVMQPETVEVCLVEADAADSAGDASRMRSAALAGLALCEPSSRWALDFHSALAHAEELLGSWEAAADSLRRLRRSPGITPPAGLPAQETIHAALVVDLARAGDFVSSQRARAELATWLADAEASGYTTVGLGQWADAMTNYYQGDYAAADAAWTMLPTTHWSYGQPLVEVIYLLDLARVRRAAGKPEVAGDLLARVAAMLKQFVSPGRMGEWVGAEQSLLTGGTGSRLPAEATTLRALDPVEPLSAREVQIVRLLRSEFSAPEIASHLCLSYNTVKTHTRSLYRKLDASSRSQAVAQAVKQGYL